MADDFSQVAVTFDKTSYNQGDKETLVLSGQAVSSAGSTSQDAPTVTVQASDGTTTTISPAPAAIAVTTEAPLDVIIISVDDGAKQWIVAADGKSATATA